MQLKKKKTFLYELFNISAHILRILQMKIVFIAFLIQFKELHDKNGRILLWIIFTLFQRQPLYKSTTWTLQKAWR